MNKVLRWKAKMDNYYANVTQEQFKQDLRKAGFIRKNPSQNIVRHHAKAFSISDEVVCTSEDERPVAIHL
jgi:hypothetical protein